jgi:Flp pilus assembly protein TadG
MIGTLTKIRNIWRDFVRAKDGNTLITFALAFIPVVGLTGAAVDYSHASLIKSTMQAVGDTTALAMAQTASTQTAASLQTAADNYYRAVFTRTDIQNLQVTATYSNTNGSTVVINATGTYNTSIMGVMGASFRHLVLSTTSSSSFGNTRLRVALVLDNTGSMASSNKLTALQNATTGTGGLLSQLRAAATNNGDVYVSIIPFVKDINVGSGNHNASWVYWDDANKTDLHSWDALNGTCSQSGNNTRQACYNQGSCSVGGATNPSDCTSGGTCSASGYSSQTACTGGGTCSVSGNSTQTACTASGTCSLSGNSSQSSCTGAGTCSNPDETTQSNCTTIRACSNGQYTSRTNCKNANYTWGTGTWHPGVWTPGVWTPGVWTAGVWTGPTWTPRAHSNWNGCVMDRGDDGGPDTGNYDTNTTTPTTSTPATLFPAEQYGSCPQAIMGLSYNWTGMTTEINNMVANGSTNQAIGLVHGWQSLTGGGPYVAPAMDPNYTYQQVIILLTDGLNTQDRWYGNGSNVSTPVDTRQTDTCANIKRAGITIYTIQVNTDSSPTSTLLQGCASDPQKFFLLTSSTQIVTTFNQIGTQLSKLRISR